MEVVLKPRTKLPARLVILGLLIMPILIAPNATWWIRILTGATMFILTGTYRISVIEGDDFRTRLFVGYVRILDKSCNLAKVRYVETKYQSQGFLLETFPMLESVRFLLLGIFDVLIPALGGAYEIWIVTSKGRELMAWQGFNEQYFRENRDLLIARSGAELRVRAK